ncbi:hypothetical protein KW797_01570 [Candidatus Parcubacteria bacterium]|nr:hypothetical protein [Candidatus Parcubacteria bacterium]
MKKYLAVFLGSGADMEQWKALPEATRKEKERAGMQAWGKWMEDNAKAIVDMGAPLGKTKAVGKNGIADLRNEMGAYVVVEAPSHEAAAKLFENHPHFTIFPGDRVEVMECLPMPKPR